MHAPDRRVPARPWLGALVAVGAAGPAAAADPAVVVLGDPGHWAARGMPAALVEQIMAGEDVWFDHCAVCHGHDGQGGTGYAFAVIGGRGLDKFRSAQRLFVYNRSLMPFQAPGTLDAELVWQVTAWLMAQNGWLDGLDAPLGPDNARAIAIGPR